ncbi:uncharacterized protein [Arachis hypogaea]|uniref:uncharacterized protein n=1 Tax=Arachis hypogaea TaxID=3818 RepID=UPI003B21DD38
MIKCPCPKCGFQLMQTREDAYDHLSLQPFPHGYTNWLRHGEKPVVERSGLGRVHENLTFQVNQMHQMVNEAFNFTLRHGSEDTTTIDHAKDDEDVLPYLYEDPSCAARDFNDLLSDGEQELYSGCSKYSKLAFLVKLYHIKCMCSVSDKAMTMILDLLRDAFEQAKLPKTVYKARKTIRKLGIEYTKIDACPKDCMFKTSTDVLWHKEARNDDGMLRHPRDAKAWKKFEAKYTNLSKDPRNTSLILSMLIPGPKMLGNDIDVYLQPLVDELNDFPGLENLSSWNMHSGLACPTYNLDAKSHRLKDSQKWCFMGHHRFLNKGHKYRLDRNRFDRQVEGGDPPKKLFGTDVLRQQSNVHVSFWKISTVTSKKNAMARMQMKMTRIGKRRVGKSKDNLKACKDLQCMGIRHELWLGEGGKYPPTIFAMSNSQRDVFLKTPQNVVFPYGYSSNVMEIIFPPSFVTVMVHLTVHLVEKVTLGGPIHYQCMYPIERYLGRLKQYLDNVETRINRSGRVDDQPDDVTHNARETMFPAIGKAIGAVSHFELTPMEKHQAHHHVLVNYNTVVPFVDCHFTVVLFKCVWVDTTTSRDIKQDHLGLTSVNFSRSIHTGVREEDEPYILASEAQLVYYVDDEIVKEWSVVVHVKPRDLYDMGEDNEEAEVGFSPQLGLNMSAEGDIGDLQLVREDDIEDPTENASDNIDDVAEGQIKTEDFSSSFASTTFATEFMSKKFVQTTNKGNVLPEYSGEIVLDSLNGEESDSEDNLDDIFSVRIDRSMQFDLNKVTEEDNKTIEDQQREDDIHVKKICFNLNKKPWYRDQISDLVKREAHRFVKSIRC